MLILQIHMQVDFSIISAKIRTIVYLGTEIVHFPS